MAHHQLVEAGLPAVPDIGFSFFEPDGVSGQSGSASPACRRSPSSAVGRRSTPSDAPTARRLEDIALFHEQARPDVTFILGGIHAPRRLLDYRRAAPGRRLVICNGMAYSLAQRRRLLGRAVTSMGARSARECFLLNSAFSDRGYAHVLNRANPVPFYDRSSWRRGRCSRYSTRL